MNWQDELDQRLRESILAEKVDTSAVDARIRQGIAVRSRRPMWIAVTGIAALLVIGIALWPRTPRVYADAGRDHHIEVVEHQRRVWLSDPSAIDQLAQRQGVSSLAPAGYQLEHGKLCRLDGRIFLHLVYTDGAHEYSVFLRKHENEPVNGKPLYTTDVSGEHLACFQNGTLTAMVVTDQSEEAVLRFAHAASL